MTSDPLITVDLGRQLPPYIQIRDQIADLIRAGGLGEGARLPPVRQLAVDLSLAVGTVARAYQELEVSGLVHTRRGGGTRVAAQPGAAGRSRSVLVQQRARDYADSMRRLGVDAEEALAAVRAAFDSA